MSELNDAQLEVHYRNTWLCSACGRRNAMTDNCCPRCMRDALAEDEKKLASIQQKATEKCATEKCATCGRTDAEYSSSDFSCSDPWHADDHLRKRTQQKGGGK